MRISPRGLLPAAALLAAIGLALAGCQSSGSSGSQSGGNGSNADQSLSFAVPAAGAQVTSPVKVSFDVSGAEIGKPETGKMHLHVHVDGSSEYKILYAPEGTVDVPAGMHTLKAVLAQPNHSETSVTATQQVDVTGGGQAPATTSAYGAGGGYGNP
jgi:hypothetical protein